ncbi:cytochrome P450 [Aspergillus heteromorphus CBS 117.55]|uniref:Cytochrome P450 n=1 Tax=Aspergillus heteromorphus CBS 117.55 TaxID=1448321 RepID=A0A317WRK5_9EURO|nr:cytochrome P450 [Aspergillus heteromorphus CBS 117.55]PWY87558.1 cytochrome P450 [Aspergillus heteromorphus CBS 117.55]
MSPLYSACGIILLALTLSHHFRNHTSLAHTHTLFLTYGLTYQTSLLTHRLTFTSCALNTKHILCTAFTDFDSSPLRKPLFTPITPHGIFTLDGLAWKRSREQLRARLSNLRRTIDLSLCEEHFRAFLKHVPPDGGVFDAQRVVFALSLDLQTRFSLGESVDALGEMQSEEQRRFLGDLARVKERIVRDGFRGPLRHFEGKGAFWRACARVRGFVVERVRRDIEGRRSGGVGDGVGVPEEEINQSADQALSILLANDSMSTTLSGILYCLAKDERVVTKLRDSIVDSIGLEPPTWAQLGGLQYVRWVIQEAMRLYPPVVLNARVANKMTTLPTGGISSTKNNTNTTDSQNIPILIHPNEIVVFSTWSLHRLDPSFGPDPESFYPERWETRNPESMPGYIPFNKGPRSCPGQHYATIILTYLVTRMFQTFSTVTDYNAGPWRERISMTFENADGVLVGLS